MAHDVVVLGATVAGLTVARILASEGFGVVVLDPNDEGVSAGIGHGVAAIGHASTTAAMAHFYGLAAAREHTRRNIAGLEQISSIYPEAQHMRMRDRSLPGGDRAETVQLAELFRGEGAQAEVLVAPDSISLMTDVLVVDPVAYAARLREEAVAAGSNVVHGVTVTHLARRDGATRIYFRNNMAWIHDVGQVAGMAVIDTLGVTPWGRVSRVRGAEWVPVLRCRTAQPLTEVSLHADPHVWMVRPEGEGALLLGQKTSADGVPAATEALQSWAVEHLGATELEPHRMAIDPSDHGRPVVGASAIPGGFYARGNGRGELMNGTASGHYLARLLAGHQRSSGNALPPISKLRAYGHRLLRPR